MARELGWSQRRKDEELRWGIRFLGSMGLRGVPEDVYAPRTWLAWLERLIGFKGSVVVPRITNVYSRAQFEPGEVERIRNVFESHARGEVGLQQQGQQHAKGEKRFRKSGLPAALAELPGYEEARPQHLKNVLQETGFDSREDLSLDEFLEVRHFLSVFSASWMRITFRCTDMR